MGEVIGELLPLALGIAISPVPIIAVILILLSEHPVAPSLGFAVGWVLGVTAVLVVVTLLIGPAAGATGSPSLVASVLKIILGAAAVLLGIRQWRSRPKAGATPEMPKWMASMSHVSVGRALGLGALLSGVNPKNLTLCIAAGVTLGSAELSTGDVVIAAVVFVLIASSTVVGPVLAYLAARDRMQGPLDELRGWLTLHNAAVMSVLLLVIGVSILGKGLGGL